MQNIRNQQSKKLHKYVETEIHFQMKTVSLKDSSRELLVTSSLTDKYTSP